ncbi:MAG TPA: hypothetical protein VK654_11370 [Nitrospirota bacterium]|nr:hypothetical protein [Nitrospirota bacterium]
MRKLILLLAVAAAGCATVATSPPVVPEPSLLTKDRTSLLLASPAEPGEAPAVEPEKADSRATVTAAQRESTPPRRAVALPPSQPERRSSPQTRANEEPELQNARPLSEHTAHTLSELAARNDERIVQVYVGMYQKTVKSIMGDRRNPYKKMTITGTDSQVYEVSFYLTREPRPGKPISDRMLTPVIFRKGKVVGIGAYQYKKLLRQKNLDREKPASAAIQSAS